MQPTETSPSASPSSSPRPGHRPGSYPGDRGWPLLGHLPAVARHGILQVLRDAWQRHGDFFRLDLGSQPSFVTLNPEDVDRMLISERDKFLKGRSYDIIRPLFGNGLVTAEGEDWRHQRRIAQPSFTRGSIAALADPMARATKRMLDRWSQRLSVGDDFDIHAELLQLTMWIIGDTLFDLDLSDDIERSAASFAVLFEELSEQGNAMVKLPMWLPTPANRRLRRAMTTLEEVTAEIIARRRSSEDLGDDMLGAFLAAKDEHGQPLSNELIRDEILTFFLAGHETTAIALAWSFYLLGRQPEIAAAVREEVETVLSGRQPTAADVQALDLTGRVFMEAMRLYPPAWSGSRDLREAVELSGYSVEPPATIMYVAYLIHRHPDHWPEPERFDPERFTRAAIKARHRGAYVPFSLGPRMCIGNHFSLMEGTLILAMICQRFTLEATPGVAVRESTQITLRPDPGVFMRVADIS